MTTALVGLLTIGLHSCIMLSLRECINPLFQHDMLDFSPGNLLVIVAVRVEILTQCITALFCALRVAIYCKNGAGGRLKIGRPGGD